LVTLKQMLAALVQAVESPSSGVRILDVPQIRQASGKADYFVAMGGLL
jgi:hypothetical protein